MPSGINSIDVRDSDMKRLAESLEEFLTLRDEILIIPKELQASKNDLEEARKVVEKLIKKLKNGDRSVFKDPEDWDHLE